MRPNKGREVRFRAPFAMSKYEVTFEDYDS